MTGEETRPPILVAEHDAALATVLVSSLEQLNYPVLGVASSGAEALALAASRSPGLVLMSLHLGGTMDGVQAAEQIQNQLFIPVIYLTAYSDTAALEHARITHPFGYILEPFHEREIEVAIQVALYRHRMEQALRASEQRLEAILASIGDAVMATDADGRITFLNRPAEELLGWSSERASGRMLSDVLRVSSGETGPVRLVRSGSEPVPIELLESPVLANNGAPGGHVIVVRDLSERLRAQAAHDREIAERIARLAAEREQERARLKAEIGEALADLAEYADRRPALRRVADLVAQRLGAWCVIDLEEPGGWLRIVAHRDPARVAWAEEYARRAPPDPQSAYGPYAVMRTGRAQLIERTSDALFREIARDPEHLEMLRNAGIDSYLCVPLRVRQRVIGALSVMAAGGQRYDDSELTFAQQIADRVALAVDNARLFHAAQSAKVTAERLYEEEQRTRAEAEALLGVAETISGAQLDLNAVVQRVTDETTALVGAKFGAFFYNVVREDGEAFMLYTLSGAPREAFEKFGLPRNTPLFAATFSGTGIVRLDDVRKDPRYGTMPPHYGMPKGHLPVVSYLAVPVVSRSGSVIGGLFFGHPEPARFTEQHERMAKALAIHAAIAVDNARLFQATRDAEERQAQLVRELERAVRFSEMFVGILGHDLRNPLSGITTAASLVLAREQGGRVATPLARILNSADRMSRMIDQILDFTHVRLGHGIPLRRAGADLGQICRLVLDELRTGAEEDTSVRLEVHGDPRGTWDPDRLAQLLSNLAGNALQHRRSGTPVLVSVDGSCPDRVTLTVENEGAIPAELLPVIFEPLRVGQQSRREGARGLGLGLYISQQIVLAHGGRIRAESVAPGGPTRFIVELPRAPSAGVEQVFGSNEAKGRQE